MAVTKEVWGKNSNVGAKKADMIAEINLYVCAYKQLFPLQFYFKCDTI